ncbi:MAG: ABC transporter ATP-binding protein [Ilumatobacter sp.]
MERDLAAVDVDTVSVSYDGTNAAVDAVSVHVEPGSIVALLGPSGCGKTSLLRAIAGLERPTAGSIRIGERLVSGPSTWVKPEHRNVGMVFQDGALFPHLSVADNIAFGLRAAGAKLHRSARDARVDELLELVDLVGLGNRLPDTLSGGQQQRVALARSLAPNPSVLLLDEPFSALDAGLRVQVRAEVVRILREIGVTSVFVTHDQDEAFVLGDHVAVMRDGRVRQVGTPDELYRLPVDKWVAGFVGEANFVHGGALAGRRCASTPIGSVPMTDDIDRNVADIDLLVRPEQIVLSAADAPSTGESVRGEITTVEYYGHDVRYVVRLDDGTSLAARAHPDRLFERGAHVAVGFDGESVGAVFPR